MVSLPPNAIALIGRFLGDDESRNRLFMLGLSNVHELEEEHSLYFRHDPDKLANAARIIDHVVALKPRLRKVTVTFESCDLGRMFVDADAFARFRERARTLVEHATVRLEFVDCSAEFMSAIVWDRATCDVTVMVNVVSNVSHRMWIDDVVRMLNVADSIREMVCGEIMFKNLDAPTLARVRNLTVSVYGESTLDLRHVDPAKTKVALTGEVTNCEAYFVDRLTELHSDEPSDAEELPLFTCYKSRAEAGYDVALRHVSIATLSLETLRGWIDMATLWPATVSYTLTTDDPVLLRFLKHLSQRGAEDVRLLVNSDDSALLARLVQLITRKAYALQFPDGVRRRSLALDGVRSIAEVFARLSPEQRDVWYFAEYFAW